MTLSSAENALVHAAQNIITSIPRTSNTIQITDHSVGSAALSSDGRIFTGINVFHFAGGTCAENAAIANAAEGGVTSAINPIIGGDGGIDALAPNLTHIVSVGDAGRGVISPCGRCRQILLDYHPEILIIINDGAQLRTASTKELLPFAYRIGRRTATVSNL